MRRRVQLLTILSLSIIFGYQLAFAQNVERKLLHEVFTASSDGPSLVANDTLQSVFNNNPGKWTCIKYPMNWPGMGDPYYTQEAGDRRAYYGAGFVPYMTLDGGWGNNPSSYNQTIFDQYYNVPAYLEISATHIIDEAEDSVHVFVNLNPLQNFSSGQKLHIAVVENTTTGNIGSNGETEFHYVMMKMVPDAGGTDIGSLTAGSPMDYTLSASLSGTNIEEYSDLSVVVFVQNNSSKLVHQSAWSVDQNAGGSELEVLCKVFLQGAYNSSSMMDTMLYPIIPTTQPYDVEPWNYDGDETIDPVPSNIVDWVLVELRGHTDPRLLIARKAVLLSSDGTILDTDLSTPIKFTDVDPGNYYICVYHRNHFPVMSAAPLSFPNAVAYDFSDTLNFPPYGGGSYALIELEADIFGMISGDVNKDGTIKYSGPNNDRGPVLQYIVNESGSSSITTTVNAYSDEDLNMDSTIKYSGPQNDPSFIIQNLVNLTGSSSITSVYNSIVPSGIPLFPCGDTFVDQRDGNIYPTVQIGEQCWMKKNLAYLPSVSPSDQGSSSSPFYYVYDYQGTDVNAAKATSNYQTFGVLYNWPAAMNGDAASNEVPSTVQGICPDGWFLPSDEEFKILEGSADSYFDYPDPVWDGSGYQGTDAGGNLKRIGTTYWTSPNVGGSNAVGFDALPTGYRRNDGIFTQFGNSTSFISSSSITNSTFVYHHISYYYWQSLRGTLAPRNYAYSVRCMRYTIQPCDSLPDVADAGPDTLNIPSDSIMLMANVPQNGQGYWKVVSGNGGTFADNLYANTMFYGYADSAYTLVWTIMNSCGSSSDTVLISFKFVPFICGTSLKDLRDDMEYNTVQIGSQCWMSDNLAYLPWVYPSDNQSGSSARYYVYDYQGSNVTDAKATANYQTYGVLYNWPAAMDGENSSSSVPSGVQGVCPTGWHLPSDEEWKILEGNVDSQYDYPDPEWDKTLYRGSDAGGNLKETGTMHWVSPNIGATNSSGFTALPGGSVYQGDFINLGNNGHFWTSTDNGTKKWSRQGASLTSQILRLSDYPDAAILVRCVWDSVVPCTPQPTQADAGPDTLNINSGSIVLMGNTPVDGQGLWRILSGQGGSFSDNTDPNSVFFGLSDSLYILEWSIVTSCGTTTDTVIIGFANVPFSCGNLLLDARDGEAYQTVSIGSQCWMAKNLAYLPSVSPSSAGSETTPYYYVYNYEGTNVNAAKATSNYQTYGVLYNWPAAMAGHLGSSSVPSGVQGVCPTGWHLPSDEEWEILEGEVDSQYNYPDPEWDGNGFRGTDAGGNIKESGTTHWNSPNIGATNSSGFAALPAGYRYNDASLNNLGFRTIFWSTTENFTGSQAYYRGLYHWEPGVDKAKHPKDNGFSVRCVWDSIVTCTTQPTQAQAGQDTLNIAADSIVLMANTPTEGQGTWSIVIGSGGSFSDASDPNSTFFGLADETFTLVWTICNNCACSTDTVIIGFAYRPFVCGDPMRDERDGEVYNTVFIGSQCWMAENLNYGSRIDGSNDQYNNGVVEKYCYSDNESYCNTYGGLYQWAEMMNYIPIEYGQGICPDGWHVPSDHEWKVLEGTVDSQYPVGDPIWDQDGYRGFDAGKNLKATNTWNTSTGTDLFGFKALASGRLYGNDHSYDNRGIYAFIWVSKEYSNDRAWCRYINYSYDNIRRSNFYKNDGRSVRCIKNCDTVPSQADAGNDILNIMNDSVILMATLPSNHHGVWTIESGTGGTLSDFSNPNSIFYGLADEKYTLVWTVCNNCECSSDTVVLGFVPVFNCGDLLTDSRDGNSYSTVLIGSQCWMAENLNVGLAINSQNSQIDNDTIEKYCYNDDSANCETYGGLYQWDEMMQYKTNENNDGICPEGWHLPSDYELYLLENFVDTTINDPDAAGWRGVDAGAKLKPGGSSGFNGQLCGVQDSLGVLIGLGDYSAFWSATGNSSGNAFNRGLEHLHNGVKRELYPKIGANSVRCVKGYPNIINSNIIIIDTNTTALLSDSAQLAQGIYVFKKMIRDSLVIDTSNIIIGVTSGGYLRKVTSIIQLSPDSMIVYTDSATLEDVFVSGEFGVTTDLNDTIQFRSLKKGLIITHLAKGVTLDYTREGYVWNFNNVTLYQNGPINLSIPNGHVAFDPEFTFEFKFRNKKVKKLAFYTDDALVETSVDLNLDVTQAAQIMDEELTLASHNYIFGFMAGIVPIIVDIKTDLKAYTTLDLESQFDATTGYTNTNTLSVGITYEYGNWGKMFDLNKSSNVHPLTINGHVNLTQSVKIVPEVSVKFYSVLGPYFNIESYEDFAANHTIPSMDFDANLGIGLNTNIGAEVSIFGYTLAEYNKQQFGFEKELWNMPDKLIMFSGNNQTDSVTKQLVGPIRVRVIDNLNNTFSNIPVHFNITSGGGTLSQSDVMTDAYGYAMTYWTLGPDPGQNTLTASVVKADGTDINGSPLTFEATGIGTSSCPTSFTDSRDGNVYSAVQIGSQCWMAENLNYSTPFSWCYKNHPTECDVYGRLYNWFGAMDSAVSSNSVPSGVQGACPAGWHLPSDEEWKILEGEVDSQYGYPDPEWDDSGWCGTDAGGNLKETDTIHWYSPNYGATNSSGFTALPAGNRVWNGDFHLLGERATFWSSTIFNGGPHARFYYLHNGYQKVNRANAYTSWGFSVRCLKD